MKFKQLMVGVILGVAALLPLGLRAQNLYSDPRELILAAPTNFTTIGQTTFTNGPVDLADYDGEARFDLMVYTNAANAVWKATFETSDDITNWVAIPKYALATTTTLNITNRIYGGTNLFAANSVQLPGTIVVPSASSGFATPYLSPSPFTNSGAIVVSKGVYTIGVPINDGKRYWHVIWDDSGSTAAGTNITVTATITAQRTISL